MLSLFIFFLGHNKNPSSSSSISFHHLLFLSIFSFFFLLVSRSSSLFGSYLLVEVGPRRRLDLIVNGHNDLFVNKAAVHFGSHARLVKRLIHDLHVATAWLMSYVGFWNQIFYFRLVYFVILKNFSLIDRYFRLYNLENSYFVFLFFFYFQSIK